jgi:hypothetical protein
MISFHNLFLANIFFFASNVASLRGETKDRRRKLQSSQKGMECNHVPARVRTDGTELNLVTLYSAVVAQGNTTGLFPDTLCNAYINAYNAATNCSIVPGSYRGVGSCVVVTEAEAEEGSFLLKLDYVTNVLEGSILYSTVPQTDGECLCSCPNDRVIPGLLRNETCTCICSPQDVECMCDSPFVGDVVNGLNDILANSTFEIVDSRQLFLLDLEACNSNVTTYVGDYLCPGSETAAFAYLDTEFPSASPSGAPSYGPTTFPTEFPTGTPKFECNSVALELTNQMAHSVL